ncbi:YndJ family transporter [Rubrivirga sp.]|uniref:YndJ family transporter n=1 Tax=Rubrivirga sp. TaxID=1885344 RepID=UPI003B52D3D5
MPALTRRLARIAFAGMLVWLALLFVPLATEPGPAEEAAHLVLLAPLALVPLLLTASAPASFAAPTRMLTAASWLLMPGALGAAAAFVVPAGPLAAGLAALWVVPTLALAAWALAEAVGRRRAGTLDATELAVAVGWSILPGGALCLVLARSGVDVGASPLAVLLATVHVHYAGAFALVWAGLLGRTLPDGWRRPHAVLVAGLVVGSLMIALGVAWRAWPSGSLAVASLGAALLTLSAAGVGGLGVVRAGSFEDRTAGLMVAVSGGALVLAMGLAAWVQFGARLGLDPPDVAWTAERYGWLVAYGFGLWGALGWRRLRPRPRGG